MNKLFAGRKNRRLFPAMKLPLLTNLMYVFFMQYGEVLNVLVSTKKTGSAVAEFATVKAAVSIFFFLKYFFFMFFFVYFKDVCNNSE